MLIINLPSWNRRSMTDSASSLRQALSTASAETSSSDVRRRDGGAELSLTPGIASEPSISRPNARPRHRARPAGRRSGLTTRSAIRTVAKLDQTAFVEGDAKLAQISFDRLQGLSVLRSEPGGGFANGRRALEHLEHPPAGRAETVVLPRLEVEDDRLTRKRAIHDVLGKSHGCVQHG